MTGTKPNFIQYPAWHITRTTPTETTSGRAWAWPGRPPAQSSGLGRLLLGSQDGDSVIRGGFAMAYQRPGMFDFTGTFGANQGIAVNLLRDNTNTALPILLRDQPALPAAPTATYPIQPTSITNTVNAFDTNLQIPYTQSYTVGWQRQLGPDTAFEFRWGSAAAIVRTGRR